MTHSISRRGRFGLTQQPRELLFHPLEPTASATAQRDPTIDCAVRMRLAYSTNERNGLNVCTH